jgi:hypothetical protein
MLFRRNNLKDDQHVGFPARGHSGSSLATALIACATTTAMVNPRGKS